MAELSQLLQLTSNVNGDIFMRGKKIRVKKGMPDSIAVVDTIAALYDLNAKAAQKKWNRLLGDHPEVGDKTVSVRFSSRSGTSTPAAGINNLVYIISKLKGPMQLDLDSMMGYKTSLRLDLIQFTHRHSEIFTEDSPCLC